jgi:hypothetical protein
MLYLNVNVMSLKQIQIIFAVLRWDNTSPAAAVDDFELTFKGSLTSTTKWGSETIGLALKYGVKDETKYPNFNQRRRRGVNDNKLTLKLDGEATIVVRPRISESMGTGVIRVTGEADFEDVTDQAVSRPSEDFNRANSKNQALVEADVNVKVKVGDKEPIALPFESEVRFYETAREERGAPNEVVDIEFGGKFNFTEGGHRDKMSFGATAIVKFWEISYT